MLFEQLELILQLKYQNDQYTSPFINSNRSAIKKYNMGLKYLVFDPNKYYEKKVNIFSWKANFKFNWRQLIPAVAIYGGADLNFSNNPFQFIAVDVPIITPRAILITQNQLGNRWVFVTNTCAEYISSPTLNYGYIATLTHSFSEKFSAFLENKGLFGEYYSDQLLSAGVAYLISEDSQIDLIVTKNFKESPSILYAGLGFSIRFDERYKDNYLKVKSNKRINKNTNRSKSNKKQTKEKERIKEALGE